MISIKLQTNFIEITLRHECSLLNLLHIFKRPFPKSTYRRLLLIIQNNISFLFKHDTHNCRKTRLITKEIGLYYMAGIKDKINKITAIDQRNKKRIFFIKWNKIQHMLTFIHKIFIPNKFYT